MVPIDPGATRVDLTRKLPLADRSLDAIYGYHVLEHLDRHESRALLQECRRVLRPGGWLRISTPDFKHQVASYLGALEAVRARPGDSAAKTRLEFMRLVLLDQRVRRRSGGRTLEFLRRNSLDREAAREILGEVGPWFLDLVEREGSTRAKDRGNRPAAAARIVAAVRRRLRWRRSTPWWAVDCRETRELEISTWDRVSLGRELQAAGFVEVDATTVDRSRIAGWERFDLDRCPASGRPLEISTIAEGRSP